ncbi:ABC transporter ATP-binding protein [Thermoflavimicrobium dichotomicum]|uniref:Branched-chain amino acid transport system ATP-binding protein n=1 Tax=Thermoflavimicrobium dichotomicum TaxID=46223 RepID=A0A1I3PVL7_9BACL|nr:ABC transporter ATP-binding protein [Thermoflavimicrobium dichotomicum]SFJ25698.1 branched-chain amino acid transport system ATP-binding protein [Thermoflavimicrobium dichotomicum]
MLKTEKLTKSFGGNIAVNAVDFQINQGEITAIIGPNGAGKTTFFNLISGLHRPTSGKIFLEGEDVTNKPSYEIAKMGIARTFQTTKLFAEATVMDNLIIGHRLRTKSGFWSAVIRSKRYRKEESECREKALQVLEFVGASELANRPVASISQEEQKRVAIALALATDPKLVLLDEPAAGINADETSGLAELIKKMKQAGLTICIIEHKMQMIMNLADRIMVLNQGTKIAEGTPAEISRNETVIEAYLGGTPHAQAH